MTEPVIEVHDLVKHYRTRGRGTVHAIDGVSFRLERGKVLGLVGESGCGKSTTARLLVRLERPTSGSVRVAGIDVPRARGSELKMLRRRVQLVFQDPYSSLDPRQRVGSALTEILRVHHIGADERSRRAAVTDLLEQVGLLPATADRYPHQLSGGQRQRVGIARALAVRPEVLVLDEPVSALDVSVRAEIMNLLMRLRDELQLSYLFISHDLGMVRHLADEIAVMYLGQIVEYGSWDEISDRPRHPYARALQAAVPIPDPATERTRARLEVAGEVPDAAHPPAGCRFHPRCPLAEDVCRTRDPVLAGLPSAPTDYLVACHVVQRQAAEPIGESRR